MRLLDILFVLDDLKYDQRELVLAVLLEELSWLSHYAILEAQLEWNAELISYAEFIKHQNGVIKDCIRFETSSMGRIFRREEGLPPLTMSDDIEI